MTWSIQSQRSRHFPLLGTQTHSYRIHFTNFTTDRTLSLSHLQSTIKLVKLVTTTIITDWDSWVVKLSVETESGRRKNGV